jgi:hypothetical protein
MREDLGYIEADLSMLRPDDGGCKTPLWTGYPPNWWLPGKDERVYASAVVELMDIEKLPPGGRGRVRIRPFAPELWTHVRIGSALDMCEGQHRVGEATVTGIVVPRPAVVHAVEPEPVDR